MPEKRTEAPVHSVTLRFAGPLAEKMADHFFTNWLDGGLDQIWEESLDDADIAEGIKYDWDPATRTFLIEAIEEDDDEDDEVDGEAKQVVEGLDEAAAENA